MRAVLEDLVAERDVIRSMLGGASIDDFAVDTPAEGWSVADQVSHLAFYDERASAAVVEPDSFLADVASIGDDGMDAYMARHLDRGRRMAPGDLMEWMATAEAAMVGHLSSLDPDERVAWYGPPMRARSFAIARLMETWAHGQDIADALGVTRPATDRLFHVADLGIRTFRFSYENRGLAVPEQRVRVALRGPTGIVRVWNDEYDESITGPVEEFCLVVTQRRHVKDTHLFTEGPIAAEWMTIAQAFAGPPGPGRVPSAG